MNDTVNFVPNLLFPKPRIVAYKRWTSFEWLVRAKLSWKTGECQWSLWNHEMVWVGKSKVADDQRVAVKKLQTFTLQVGCCETPYFSQDHKRFPTSFLFLNVQCFLSPFLGLFSIQLEVLGFEARLLTWNFWLGTSESKLIWKSALSMSGRRKTYKWQVTSCRL